jgi:nucleoside-diphosphate kinase
MKKQILVTLLATVMTVNVYAQQPTQGQPMPTTVEDLKNPENTNVQQTLSIIKPDAVKNQHIGDIISKFEKSGLRIAALKETQLTKEQASRFYQVHKDRPFYPALVEFMTSGPVVIIVLEGKDAILKNREIMGATDPSKAEKGTLRAEFAESVTRNAVHGSDSQETAKEEISFFFAPNEIFGTK